jgi:hypothetical protein
MSESWWKVVDVMPCDGDPVECGHEAALGQLETRVESVVLAVREAEVDQDGSPERRAYLIGLRVAAALLDLPEGLDPASGTVFWRYVPEDARLVAAGMGAVEFREPVDEEMPDELDRVVYDEVGRAIAVAKARGPVDDERKFSATDVEMVVHATTRATVITVLDLMARGDWSKEAVLEQLEAWRRIPERPEEVVEMPGSVEAYNEALALVEEDWKKEY